MTEPHYVGRAVPRKEDRRLLTGAGQYVGDIRLPGMVEAAFLRSAYPHALITRLDVSRAASMPGVAAVFTADDLDGSVADFTRPFYRTVASNIVDETELFVAPYHAPVLARTKVLRVGEPIAVVLATNRYVAEDALEAIEIEYEPLEAAIDPERALEADAPVLLPDAGDNLHASFTLRSGDVEAAFSRAPYTIKERIKVGRSVGVPMETRGVLATFDAGRRELLIFSTQQRPHLLRSYVAEMLDLDESRIRVVSPDMGGSFGGGIYNEEIILPAIAIKTGRPVRWIEDRHENLLNARHSRDQLHDVEVAFDDDGRITALKDDFIVDTGAYNPFTITLSFNTAAHLRGQFSIDTYEIAARCVATNKLQTTPIRGAGRPEAVFVMERIVDMVGRRLRRDPVEIRRANLIPADQMPHDTRMLYRDGKPMIYDGGDYPEQLEMALRLAGYASLRQTQAEARAEGRSFGIGISSYVEGSGYGPHEGVMVAIEPGGDVVLHSGSNPHGQSHETVLAQVCADELGVDFDRVTVRAGDTALIQHGGGTFASRSAVTAGSAALLASRKLRDKVVELAAACLEASSGDLRVENGCVSVVGSPTKSVTFAELAEAATPGSGVTLPAGMEPGLEARSYFVPPTVTFSSGTHIAAVEVDDETGFVEIKKYVVIDECGRVLNPTVVDGQIRGSVVHGVGNALFEEMPFSEDGQPLAGTFMDYLLPTACEAPRIEIGHQECLSPLNPLGAKGVGEGGTAAAPAAIASAIVDALEPLGITITQVPMTPERVCAAIRRARAGAPNASGEPSAATV